MSSERTWSQRELCVCECVCVCVCECERERELHGIHFVTVIAYTLLIPITVYLTADSEEKQIPLATWVSITITLLRAVWNARARVFNA